MQIEMQGNRLTVSGAVAGTEDTGASERECYIKMQQNVVYGLAVHVGEGHTDGRAGVTELMLRLSDNPQSVIANEDLGDNEYI